VLQYARAWPIRLAKSSDQRSTKITERPKVPRIEQNGKLEQFFFMDCTLMARLKANSHEDAI
jgi:hypothetical protein